MANLTPARRDVLATLFQSPFPRTAQGMRARDRVLTALADDGLVQRTTNKHGMTAWELTDAGRQEASRFVQAVV